MEIQMNISSGAQIVLPSIIIRQVNGHLHTYRLASSLQCSVIRFTTELYGAVQYTAV